MDRLVLFDIDRTLIGRSYCHHEAFSYAFKKVYNKDADIKIINYGGMSDPAIAIQVLKKIGVNEDIIFSRLNECMNEIVKFFLSNVKRDRIPLLPGVNELLESLRFNGAILGLVSGGLEPVAWGKLESVGIDHYFKVGGFGSDSTNRTELVKIAINKAVEEFEFNGITFVIGDTPRDIKAGFEADAKTIAVATGTYSVQELQDYGADFVFENLENTENIVNIIMQYETS